MRVLINTLDVLVITIKDWPGGSRVRANSKLMSYGGIYEYQRSYSNHLLVLGIGFP